MFWERFKKVLGEGDLGGGGFGGRGIWGEGDLGGGGFGGSLGDFEEF